MFSLDYCFFQLLIFYFYICLTILKAYRIFFLLPILSLVLYLVRFLQYYY